MSVSERNTVAQSAIEKILTISAWNKFNVQNVIIFAIHR